MKETANALHIEVSNSTRYRVNEDAVAELARTVLAAEGVTVGELGVNFVGERRMRALNRAYRAADYVTDVLAFPLEEPQELASPREESQELAAARAVSQEPAPPLTVSREPAPPLTVSQEPALPLTVSQEPALPPAASQELAAPRGEVQESSPPLVGAQESARSPVPRLLGDVVVCLKQAERQAAEGGLALSLEVATLLVHGILHILGYDHETDAGEMARREEELRRQVAWQSLVIAAGG